MTERIVVVGVPWNADDLGAFIRALARSGVTATVVDRPEQLAMVSVPLAARSVPVERMDVSDVARVAERARADYVLSLTEMHLVLAAEVRAHLGMPGNGPSVERDVKDKARMRRIVGAGVPGAELPYTVTSAGGLRTSVSGMTLPVVVKPTSFAGSNGVCLVRHLDDVDDVLAECVSDDVPYIVEEYIGGVEISIDGIVTGGRFIRLCDVLKFNSGEPHFQELGHVLPSGFSDEQLSEADLLVQRILDAMGLDRCPVHIELKFDRGTWYLIEIHSRFGGGSIPELLTLATGVEAYDAFAGVVTMSGSRLTVPVPVRVAGVVFPTGRAEHPLRWEDLHVPHPEAVREVRFVGNAGARLPHYGGVRLRHFRAGRVIFVSDSRDAVIGNVNAIVARERRRLASVIQPAQPTAAVSTRRRDA